MASVRKRTWTTPGGEAKQAWVVDYRAADGKRRQRQFKRWKDADAHRRQIERKLDDGTHVADRATVTFADACEDFVRACERRRQAEEITRGTVRNYRNAVRLYLVPAFGERLLTAITASMVQEFVDAMAERYKWRTVTATMGVLRLVLRHAVGRRWLKVSPLVDARIVGSSGRRYGLVAVPTPDDLWALLRSLEHRQKGERLIAYRNRRLITILALFSGGMRRGEICGLHWEDIDFAAGWIRVRRSLSDTDGLKEPKTRSSRRQVALVEPVRAELEAYAAARKLPRTGYVLRNEKGGPLIPSNVTSQSMPLIMRAAGLIDPATGKKRFSLHKLRHAAASLLIREGVPAFHISKILGHSNPSLTLNVYGHLFPGDEIARTALDTVAGRFAGAPGMTPSAGAGAGDEDLGEEVADLKSAVRVLYQRGVQPADIVRRLGLNRSTVYAWLTGLVPPRPRRAAVAAPRQHAVDK